MAKSSTPTRHTRVETSLGELVLVGDDAGLVGLYYPGHRPAPDPGVLGPRVASDPILDEAARQLRAYLSGDRRTFDVPLAPRGTPRALEVWRLIAEIPYGATTTYKNLAASAGHGSSPRAVGGFVAHNPLSVVVPCHRVVGSDGSLTGYAGGLDRKRRLLELESALPPVLVGLS